ncbi:hypothetical protein [Winogradskyella forsetii]|uniref:hypothetical protein n=1 Tax=Winogradskyella forsetii TaxID=2686077 RepID=UPI0015BC608C|nr:hypothetical protein [Winogradskyella forsetii]
MDKEEKKKHLENIKARINRMTPNQMNINELSELIKSELRNEENLDQPNKVYIFNLKQTTRKQLDNLLNSRKKANNRIDEFNETRSNFKQDIDRCLGDLRQNP